MGKKTNPPGIKLTIETAKKLAKRELGTAKGVWAEGGCANSHRAMLLGNLVILIRPEQIGGKWYIAMIARWTASGADRSIQFFDPKTLEKDFGAEDRHWEQHRQDQFQDWVEGHGVEYCCQKVKEAWGKQR